MRRLIFTLVPLLLLGACHKAPPAPKSLDTLDNELVDGAAVDETPANRALGKAIHVDRAATVRLGSVAVRQRSGQRQVTEDGGSGCLSGLGYSNDWATRLPADLPMHPQAKLQEAAGHDGDCKARVASFTVAGDRQAVLGWYTDKARASGYDASRENKGADWILAGDKGDAAFAIIVGPAVRGETPVDYIWTQGG